MIGALAACSSDKKVEKKEEPKANAYTLSDNVKDGSVIDGVMTDIKNDNPILKRTTPEWIETCVLYEVNIRQYTEEGTFAAFEKHLDRLKETGINTLWLMPIHPISETKRKGTLGSYYSVTDYKGVNPESRMTSSQYSSPLISGYQRGGFPVTSTVTVGVDVKF
jgi:pullulanase/glycogen debranching enzyme